jgi:hypothetical protein
VGHSCCLSEVSVVDGGPDCTACGYWVNVLGGFGFENVVPAWALVLSVVVGALIGALIVWGWGTASARVRGGPHTTELMQNRAAYAG